MGHEVLSCLFLANYMSKYQMSSGPYGPTFLNSHPWTYIGTQHIPRLLHIPIEMGI